MTADQIRGVVGTDLPAWLRLPVFSVRLPFLRGRIALRIARLERAALEILVEYRGLRLTTEGRAGRHGSMIDGRVIRGVDLTNSTFMRTFSRIRDPQLQRVITATIRELLLLNLDQAPAKLKLHQLRNKQVPSALDPQKKVNPFTIHVTPDDRYKASSRTAWRTFG